MKGHTDLHNAKQRFKQWEKFNKLELIIKTKKEHMGTVIENSDVEFTTLCTHKYVSTLKNF